MRLFHYSVDSYKGGESLVNDYKNQYQYAEPFILALQQGIDVFRATYYATMYLGRELVELKLRKYENYQKDAIEAIFEFVRETEFTDMPGRLKCVFFCKTEEEAIAYVKEDCLNDGLFAREQVKLLEVDVPDERIREYDQTFFNRAEEEIQKNNFEEVFCLARKYYSLERTDDPLIEVVSDGPNRILREVDY